MNIVGKLVGLLFGIVVFHNPLAILAGLALGHLWDERIGRRGLFVDKAPLSFVAPLFGLAGAIAKSDGRVSEAEIAAAERLMARMQLERMRGSAIAQFTAGKQLDYSTTNAIVQLKAWCAGRRDRAILLLDLLLDIVCADGPLAPAKLVIVRKLCAALGVSERQIVSLAVMKGYTYVAPENWRAYTNAQGRERRATARPLDKDPYLVLGIERSLSDAEIKHAYRKLMSQNHPDKLGDVPEELKRRAEERAREINAAYERIKSERGFT